MHLAPGQYGNNPHYSQYLISKYGLSFTQFWQNYQTYKTDHGNLSASEIENILKNYTRAYLPYIASLIPSWNEAAMKVFSQAKKQNFRFNLIASIVSILSAISIGVVIGIKEISLNDKVVPLFLLSIVLVSSAIGLLFGCLQHREFLKSETRVNRVIETSLLLRDLNDAWLIYPTNNSEHFDHATI